MNLRIEKYFGLTTVAALGVLAVACAPNIRKDAAVVEAKAAPAGIPIDLEIESARQVNAINSQIHPPVFSTESSPNY